MNSKVDDYLRDGCGRCPLVATPECKVNDWRIELSEVRRILLTTELTEEVKWSAPCYTFDGKNVSMLSALRGSLVLSFFKGVLLSDPEGVLQKPGKHSRIDRLFRFTSVEQILEMEPMVKALSLIHI